MNIIFPKNIFTSIIAVTLPEDLRSNLQFQPSSSISGMLEKHKDSIAIISSTDILNHRELFVSKKYGISFESSLCNSYLYYSEDRSLNTLNIAGDVSSLEAIISKILFKELYGSEVEVALSTSLKKESNNLLLVGEQNFYDDKLFNGISFSEEILELISLPFVNFVLASANEDLLKQAEPLFAETIPDVYNKFDSISDYFTFSDKTQNHIINNISSLVLNLDMQDIEGFLQLIRLPYFYGMVKDIVDVKFV